MSKAGAVKYAFYFFTRRRLPYLRGYLQLLCRMPLHSSFTKLIPQFYDQARRRSTAIEMTLAYRPTFTLLPCLTLTSQACG
jgi:hypothetical protein